MMIDQGATRNPRTVARMLLALLLAIGLVTASDVPQAHAQAEEVPDGWPNFGFQEIVTDKSSMSFNPTNEYIFPSIFHAGYYLDDPLGEWYLYYAPHDPPGGISLMYSDSLDGPWTEYEDNPIIPSKWEPHFDVSHVSTPETIWMESEEEVYLYFHGENSHTRWATSSDGINFSYGGTALENSMSGAEVTETSYARVFEHPNPDSPYQYGMFYMANERDDIRRIRLAESLDGENWEVVPGYVVEPGQVEGQNVSSANLWEWNGTLYVTYHASSGSIYARTIDQTLRNVGEEPLLLHSSSGVGADTGRVAAPEIVTHDGQTYLFYEAGDRLGATIAFAKDGFPAKPVQEGNIFAPDPTDPLNAHCSASGSDEFDTAELSTDVWHRTLRAEDARHFLDDGALHIPTYAAGVAGVPLIQQELSDEPWEVTTKVNIDATERFQQAGLLLYASDSHYAKFDLGRATPGPTVELVYHRDGNNRQDSGAPKVAGATTLWLRLTNDGSTIKASVSYDGETFENYGRDIDVQNAGFTHIGPYAFMGDTEATEIAASFDWFRFSPTALERVECLHNQDLDTDTEIALPGEMRLTSTSGWLIGQHDGNYSVKADLNWGANASKITLLENGSVVDTRDLTPNGPLPQSLDFDFENRPNGEYAYQAVLTNSEGTTATDPLTVTVADAHPGQPVLSHDNWSGTSDFTITANLWWGTNASEFRLLENGSYIKKTTLDEATPQHQTVQTQVPQRASGHYTYVAEFINDNGITRSEPITVFVK